MPECYVRITSIQTVVDSAYTVINASWYYTQAVRDAGNPPVRTSQYALRDDPAELDDAGVEIVPATTNYTTYGADAAQNASGKTPMKSAYAYLKTLDEFTGAVDS
tara:strand:- start:546 stop:860 length:315 start_codon:yes stop_codon:yes gene_type:complete